MSHRCIIIGASHAAAQLTTSLRQEGWNGEILVIGDEPHLPYHRPALSKGFLSGDITAKSLSIRPATFYERNNVQFLQGRVAAINRNNQTLMLSNGNPLRYDKLALCTGSRVRKVELPGCDLNGIHYLRDLSDAECIKSSVVEGQQAVILGGCYVGLETAASLRKLGMQVTVLEIAPRILQGVTAPEVSEFYHRVQSENGVRIHTDVSVTGFSGKDYVEGVICADGFVFPADLVVVSVGVVPNTELAEVAGLNVDNGIMVDDFCVTNDRNIVAAGDCTIQFSRLYGRRIRLESVPNAIAQAKVAAATLCFFHKFSDTLPWFWSDQYGLTIQIAGLNQGYDEVVIRGDLSSGESFAAFYLLEGRLIAANCVNRPQEFVLSNKMIAGKIHIKPERLADDSVPVKELIFDVSSD